MQHFRQKGRHGIKHRAVHGSSGGLARQQCYPGKHRHKTGYIQLAGVGCLGNLLHERCHLIQRNGAKAEHSHKVHTVPPGTTVRQQPHTAGKQQKQHRAPGQLQRLPPGVFQPTSQRLQQLLQGNVNELVRRQFALLQNLLHPSGQFCRGGWQREGYHDKKDKTRPASFAAEAMPAA